MRRLIKLVAAFTVAALAFASCSFGIDDALDVNAENAVVYFSIESNERTAVPSNFNWGEYTFSLSAVESYGDSAKVKPSVDLFTGRRSADLAKPITLQPVNYLFTLTAYSGTTPVLAGTTEVSLSEGSQSVSFRMYPLAGAKGSATITLNIPDDGVISTIKAGWSTNPAADASEIAASKMKTLEINQMSSGRRAVCSLEGLDSAVSQFVIFYMYDANGGLIMSMPEALLVVGNKVSSSSITITAADYHRYQVRITLKKNNENWTNSGKTLSLVSKDGNISYALKNSNGGSEYAASVSEGTYYICSEGKKTSFVCRSVQKTATLDYYTVVMKPGDGIDLLPVSGSEEFYGQNIVLKGDNFVYKASLKPGFEFIPPFEIKINSLYSSNQMDTNLTCADVSEPLEISTSGAKAIVFTIAYSVGADEGVWIEGATKPLTFTALEDCALPTAADIRGNGKILDGWKLSADATSGIAYIKAGTVYRNIVLYPIWKDAASVDTLRKTIYANGISLIIQENEENSLETNIYLDINSNGLIDEEDGDVQVVALDGTTDFTDYELMAGNKNGTPISSDFVFTMTGGKIASITGLGAEKSNRSYLRISGSSKIGSYVEIPEEDGTFSYTSVRGVDLSSIYMEQVYVTGQMTDDYKVIVLTQYDYDPNVGHYIAEIANSNYANFKRFMCFKQNGVNSFTKSLIAMKDILGENKTVIRIVNPDPIAMPGISGEDAIIGDPLNGFTLGQDRISTECSVFSISVKNGTFTVGQTTLEGATETLAQPTPTTYETSLAEYKTYVYMHIFSAGNDITPEKASEFLSSVTFRRNPETPDIPVEIKINLETVPYTDIIEAQKTCKAFSYFDGSFYMGIQYGSTTKWSTCYNLAKEKEFNGLKGYLMTISSEVENTYIFSRMGLGASWIGGSRAQRTEEGFDTDTFTKSSDTNNTTWYWQCGPEAGTAFWTSKTYGDATTAGNLRVQNEDGSYVYQHWSNTFLGQSTGKEPNNSGTEECVQYLTNGYWNDLADGSSTPKGYIVEFTPYGDQTGKYQSITRAASY